MRVRSGGVRRRSEEGEREQEKKEGRVVL